MIVFVFFSSTVVENYYFSALRKLYFEGQRRLDLVRFEQYTDQGIWPWKGDVKEGRTTESFRNIFPLHASDLLANPNLIQNPGY